MMFLHAVTIAHSVVVLLVVVAVVVVLYKLMLFLLFICLFACLLLACLFVCIGGPFSIFSSFAFISSFSSDFIMVHTMSYINFYYKCLHQYIQLFLVLT